MGLVIHSCCGHPAPCCNAACFFLGWKEALTVFTGGRKCEHLSRLCCSCQQDLRGLGKLRGGCMALLLPCCVTLVVLSCVYDVKSLFHGEVRAWCGPCRSPVAPWSPSCPAGAGSYPRGHLWHVSVWHFPGVHRHFVGAHPLSEGVFFWGDGH